MGILGKLFFWENLGTRVCDPMGIMEGPCGYSTCLVGTQGKLVFRETSGESVPVEPRIDISGACGSASLPKTTQLRHASPAPGLRFCGDSKCVVEFPPGHANRDVGVRLNSFYRDLHFMGPLKH